MWIDEYKDELYHHGVKGMKWGHRKSPERARYNKEKKAFKQAGKDFRKNAGSGFGIKGIQKYDKALAKYQKAESRFISEKAKFKAGKSKKAELKYYTSEMLKSGIPGSARDRAQDGRSTRLYNQIKKDKGKKYADNVMKKTQNKAVAAIATSVAVTVGVGVVQGILEANRG